MRQVERDPLPADMGGDMPMNPAFQSIISKWLTQGEILEKFFGKDGASKDPALAFYNDPGWLQWYSMQMQQPAQDAQTASVDLQNQGTQMQLEQAQDDSQHPLDPNIATVHEGIDQLSRIFKPQAEQPVTKSEKMITPNNKKLLSQQHQLTRKIVDKFEIASRQEIENIKKMLLKK